MRAAVAGEEAPGALDARDRGVVDRFMVAWRRCDVAGLAELLRDDAIMRMPPEAVEIRGRAAIATFFATVPAGGQLDQIRLHLTRANGQPTLAAYLPDPIGRPVLYGLMVPTISHATVAVITGFPDPTMFPIFDLPTRP